MTQETYLQRSRQTWRKRLSDPRLQKLTAIAGWCMTGFLLSSASIGSSPQPLAMALVCVTRGWRALSMAVGSSIGYRAFWGDQGTQGTVWSLGGFLIALILGRRSRPRGEELLLPAAGALVVSLTGLAFQIFAGDTTAVPVYLLRVAAAGGGIWLLDRFREKFLPESRQSFDVDTAQVRLEIMAGALTETMQLLLEMPPFSVDEDALLARTRERACGGCPNRKGCNVSQQLTSDLLHLQLTDTTSLHVHCRKPNRLLLELRRSQEQLRMLKAEGKKRMECREAVIQQYRFLADYLRKTSDELVSGQESIPLHYKPEVQIGTLSKEMANGDRCQAFSGVGGRFYVLLCDGMGTGMGAAQEGQTALTLLRRMLTAGFPVEYALGSVNSLCCLRSRAGAVTIDLAELRLDTGKVTLYKWGAAPSILVRNGAAEKIGTVVPPPGLGLGNTQETVDRLSLRRGEALILMSDGVEIEEVLRTARIGPGEPLGEFAARLLAACPEEGSDDATVAAIRLHPTSLST